MSGFMIALGAFGCGARILWNPLRIEDWIAVLMISLVALMMIGLGMLLSLIAKTVKSATNLSVVIGLMLVFIKDSQLLYIFYKDFPVRSLSYRSS